MNKITITTGKQLDDFISSRVDLILPSKSSLEWVEATNTLIGVKLNSSLVNAKLLRARQSVREYLENELLDQLNLPVKLVIDYANIVVKKEGL